MTLKEEIAAGETHELEFKVIPNEDRAKYLKTAVAFANGKGGRILFGVANEAFRNCGLRDLSVEDVGFATRMNIFRSGGGALNGAINW